MLLALAGHFNGVKYLGYLIGIVVGDSSHGTEHYLLNLYDSTYSGKLNQSDPDYRAIVICAQSIYNEINNIINTR